MQIKIYELTTLELSLVTPEACFVFERSNVEEVEGSVEVDEGK